MGKTKAKPKAKRKPAKAESTPDNPAPRPPRRHLAPDTVAKAVAEYNGNLAAVARSFGVARASVWEYVEVRPELKAALRDARETRLDNAESSLDRAIEAGEGWAVTLILKTLGRDRGYAERTEHEHTGEIKHVTEIVVRTRDEAATVHALTTTPVQSPRLSLPEAS